MESRAVTTLVLLLWASAWHLSSAVRLQPSPPEEEILSKDTGETRNSMALRAGILWHFMVLDANNDSVVTLEELSNGGLGQLPGPLGETLLKGMLQACTRELGSTNCTRAQMEASLRAWPVQRARREAIGILTGARGYEDVLEKKKRRKENSSWSDAEPCGAAAKTKGVGGPMCYVQGPKCWKGDLLTAWGLHKVCASQGCLCEPTAEAKRFAKLGYSGALAVYSAQDFHNPHDLVENPQCGGDWKVEKVVGTFNFWRMSPLEKDAIRTAAKWLSPDPAAREAIVRASTDFTEVAVFSSGAQQLTKGGPVNGKVCVVSWQATRSAGDWKTNFMLNQGRFKYAPRGVDAYFQRGLLATYVSTRDKLKRAWEKRCCSHGFRANQTVISGHSHGGSLAIMQAMDMVWNWHCMGKDLGSDDIKLVTAAPFKHMLGMDTIDQVFSCSDKANCLAGSVVTLVTDNDRVGDGRFQDFNGKPVPVGMPFQPSLVTMLPCAVRGLNVAFMGDDSWWCHALFNYASPVEELLVDQGGWGSTCGGTCGNMNRLVQCSQFVLATNRGCSFAKPSELKTARPCTGWDPFKEKCICQFDSCMDLTTYGCAG